MQGRVGLDGVAMLDKGLRCNGDVVLVVEVVGGRRKKGEVFDDELAGRRQRRRRHGTKRRRVRTSSKTWWIGERRESGGGWVSGGDGQRGMREGGCEGRGGGGQAALSFCSVCSSVGWDAGAVILGKNEKYVDICERKQTFWAASVTSVYGVETVNRAGLTVGLRTGGLCGRCLQRIKAPVFCEMYAIDTAPSVCCCKTVWAVCKAVSYGRRVRRRQRGVLSFL